MKKTAFICLIILASAFALKAQTTKKPVAKPSVNPKLEKGKAAYMQYCIACHQADGGGVMGLNPPLIKTTYVLGDPKRMINIVLKGFNQEIEIDGDTYANPMPALNSLTDQQVADILSYVRNSFGNKASMITPSQVKAVRAAK
nr:cytochrome c [uncultured Pedobacter sp.]